MMTQSTDFDSKSVRDVIGETIATEMERDERIFVQGEDIAVEGGAFGLLQNVHEQYPDRVRNTPISEAAIVGSGLGAAMTGSRPVVEIMFSGFLGIAMDQLLNQVAKLRYMMDGNVDIPLTIRTQNASGRRIAAQHSQALHHILMGIPGIKVVCVSTPEDTKGLLTAAIRHDDPVVVFEHGSVYNREGEVPTGEYVIPIGEAAVERAGDDVTVVATQVQLWNALEAAEQLSDEGISLEVVSPRTFDPLDVETIAESVRKTGRCIVVDETPLTAGSQSDLTAQLTEAAFFDLDFPIQRLGVADVPLPYSPVLEDEVLPDTADIVDTARMLA